MFLLFLVYLLFFFKTDNSSVFQKFGGTFVKCIEISENSAQKLLDIVIKNFPSYRDEAVFEHQKGNSLKIFLSFLATI